MASVKLKHTAKFKTCSSGGYRYLGHAKYDWGIWKKAEPAYQ